MYAPRKQRLSPSRHQGRKVCIIQGSCETLIITNNHQQCSSPTGDWTKLRRPQRGNQRRIDRLVPDQRLGSVLQAFIFMPDYCFYRYINLAWPAAKGERAARSPRHSGKEHSASKMKWMHNGSCYPILQSGEANTWGGRQHTLCQSGRCGTGSTAVVE